MSGESGKTVQTPNTEHFLFQTNKIRLLKMFRLMPKAENAKHAHGRHHNKRHGNSRMKEPVSMEIRAAAHEQGDEEGAAVVLCGALVLQTVKCLRWQSKLRK